jgi:hypothetical protein
MIVTMKNNVFWNVGGMQSCRSFLTFQSTILLPFSVSPAKH